MDRKGEKCKRQILCRPHEGRAQNGEVEEDWSMQNIQEYFEQFRCAVVARRDRDITNIQCL